MKFTNKQKQLIKDAKNQVIKLAKEQNDIFKRLEKELKIKDNDYLFDYVYNNFGTIKLIEQNGQIPLGKKD